MQTNPYCQLNDKIYPVEVSYAGQDVSVAKIQVNNGEAIENLLKPGRVAVEKQGEVFVGAVKAKDGVHSWLMPDTYVECTETYSTWDIPDSMKKAFTDNNIRCPFDKVGHFNAYTYQSWGDNRAIEDDVFRQLFGQTQHFRAKFFRRTRRICEIFREFCDH